MINLTNANQFFKCLLISALRYDPFKLMQTNFFCLSIFAESVHLILSLSVQLDSLESFVFIYYWLKGYDLSKIFGRILNMVSWIFALNMTINLELVRAEIREIEGSILATNML